MLLKRSIAPNNKDGDLVALEHRYRQSWLKLEVDCIRKPMWRPCGDMIYNVYI